MKFIIYTLYAVTVLLFSGFARANTLVAMVNSEEGFRSPVTIAEVLVDNRSLDLQISGYVPNPCYQNPTPVLFQDKNDPATLIVRLISPSPTNFCVQRIKDYTTVISLRQLAQASQLPLDDKALYQVKTEGYEFSLEVSGQDLKN